MRFCVLGSVEVAAEGRQVALGSERQRTILGVLLAAGGEVVSTHRLIDGLWGARPPESAHKSLQKSPLAAAANARFDRGRQG